MFVIATPDRQQFLCIHTEGLINQPCWKADRDAAYPFDTVHYAETFTEQIEDFIGRQPVCICDQITLETPTARS